MTGQPRPIADEPAPGVAIVEAVAPLVPFIRRAEWKAEWTGELHHRWRALRADGRTSGLQALALRLRALGAIPDAWFLRRRLTETPMLMNDVRYAVRTLARRPAFSVVVVLTLALGIGSTTAIFSVVNAVLLRSLPFHEAERLVALRGVPTEGDAAKVASASSWPDFVDYRAAARTVEDLSAFTESVVTLTGPGVEPAPVPAAEVTSSLFAALRVTPSLGRGFGVEDERAGQPPVVLVSFGFWRTRLAGTSAALGQSVRIDGVAHTVIGIMPEGFAFPAAAQLWVPLIPTGPGLERGVHNLQVLGRLAPAASRADATAEAQRIFRSLETAYPESNTRRSAVIEPLGESSIRGVRPVLLVLFGAVGMVLLIICTNVASLFMARAAAREREVAVRVALGAGRWRIVRQLLVESVLLSLAGGMLGLAIGASGVDLLLAAAPMSVPRAAEIDIDAQVLSFVFGISMLTGAVFGALPAMQLGRVSANMSLKAAARAITATRTRRRFRQGLVVAQVSLAMVLVIGAGLMLSTLNHLQNVDPGFEPKGLVVTRLVLPAAGYPRKSDVLAYHAAVRERVAAVPGVRSAALAYEHPLSPGWTSSFIIAGREPPVQGEEPEARVRPITPGYLSTAGARLLRGRDITDHDRSGAPGVVIINEAFARRHFPGENPLGQRLVRAPWWPEMPGAFEIVGVVADERFLGLSADPDPATYFAHAQFTFAEMYLVVRGAGDVERLMPSLRAAVWSVDRNIPLDDMRTMDDVLAGALARPRFVGTLLGLFAGAALFLAALGIYGVLSYTVAQRTSEIGIRMALGAPGVSVMRTVVGQGMWLSLSGIVIGAVAALGATRALSGFLYGVRPTDPFVFAAVASLLTVIALLATWLPARRASRIDPLVALREE